MRILRIATAVYFLMFGSGVTLAAPLKIITDIPPVHSLVSMVTDGVVVPDLLLPPGASPHDFSLRPSDAQKIQDSNLLIWMGPDLVAWLADTKESLAPQARSIELIAIDGITQHSYRDKVIFSTLAPDEHDNDDHGHKQDEHGHDDHAHEHGHEKHEHEEHGHEEHKHEDDEHQHGNEEHSHDDHGHEEHTKEAEAHGHGHHDHDHDGVDIHAWLDPFNARVWVSTLAATLSEIDPDNAEIYATNAERARADLLELEKALSDRFQQTGALSFAVYHDAYQYFERRFGVEAVGAILAPDATPPSPRRVAELRDLVKREQIACVFTEPQFNPGLVNSVFESENVQILEIDPLGANIPAGKELYPTLLRNMAATMSQCRAKSS
ncbi:MAG: zinc ABC transporter substrate-binding protein [Aestuariivita sp.]|nr:zinc ABC transporter substrate-binding protein [Aestuariivita sp.]MCY4203730.1 zinc ABC transporter substrate-binding protein [Aestuariivita sp.]MCY4289107.1 zinc ABC transporter substrate-binding protein [Aestuariivita sp.]MCY4347707.1 zinc ABC transporter substrate-binding protein [Aestuariivita sp.]